MRRLAARSTRQRARRQAALDADARLYGVSPYPNAPYFGGQWRRGLWATARGGRPGRGLSCWKDWAEMLTYISPVAVVLRWAAVTELGLLRTLLCRMRFASVVYRIAAIHGGATLVSWVMRRTGELPEVDLRDDSRSRLVRRVCLEAMAPRHAASEHAAAIRATVRDASFGGPFLAARRRIFGRGVPGRAGHT